MPCTKNRNRPEGRTSTPAPVRATMLEPTEPTAAWQPLRQALGLVLAAVDAVDSPGRSSRASVDVRLCVDRVERTLWALAETLELRHAGRRPDQELAGAVIQQVEQAISSSFGVPAGDWGPGLRHAVGELAIELTVLEQSETARGTKRTGGAGDVASADDVFDANEPSDVAWADL